MTKIKTEYYQRLPHVQPKGSVFFVTFRLYSSTPLTKLIELKNSYETKLQEIKVIKNLHERNSKIFILRKQFFADYDILLDTIKGGPMYLGEDDKATIVKDQLHRFDGDLYDLLAYCIMSNHVHIVIDTRIQLPENHSDNELLEKYSNLDKIMKRIKGSSAIYLNRILKRKGQFWERESFDMYIRNEKMMKNVTSYILNNPVKAGIVDEWGQFKWNYQKEI